MAVELLPLSPESNPSPSRQCRARLPANPAANPVPVRCYFYEPLATAAAAIRATQPGGFERGGGGGARARSRSRPGLPGHGEALNSRLAPSNAATAFSLSTRTCRRMLGQQRFLHRASLRGGGEG